MKMSDEWCTPAWLFEELSREHEFFDIDLCATRENSKCGLFCKDYLTRDLRDFEWANGGPIQTAFMNPPYSNPKPFIEKAWEDSRFCKIVCLVKCDPSTRWWATFWDYSLGPKPGCDVRFLPKRVKFDRPIGWEGKTSGPTFSSAIVTMDRRGI